MFDLSSGIGDQRESSKQKGGRPGGLNMFETTGMAEFESETRRAVLLSRVAKASTSGCMYRYIKNISLQKRFGYGTWLNEMFWGRTCSLLAI